MQLDKDLQAKQEARDLCKQAELAQKELFAYSQEKLDAITRAVAEAFEKAAGAAKTVVTATIEDAMNKYSH